MEKTYNLTNGKVSKQLLGFFFPMLFTNLLQQIYTFIDTVIVGRGLGDNALGAVGNLSALTLLIIGFSMGMSNGFSVAIAQNFGAADTLALRRSVALSVKLSVAISVILTAFGVLLLKPVLHMIQTSDIIFHDSLLYGYIIFGGVSATVAYNLCSGILRSLGDSRTPFLAIIISSVLNIFMDYILIFKVGTGVEGAAAATIFAQIVSVFICYLKIRKIDVLHLNREDFANDKRMYLGLLKNGIPAACMNSITAIGCMVVQGYVNGCGVYYTSAYSVCSKYLNLFMLPALTAGFAASTFTSQNYGAGEIGRIREGVRVCSVIAWVSYLMFGLAMCIFSKELAGFMLKEEKTIALAILYLRICGSSLFLLNFLFIFRNCVQGMGYPVIPMCSGIVEMVLRILVIMVFLPKIGFKATAYAETAAWIGALALNLIAYVMLLRKKQGK